MRWSSRRVGHACNYAIYFGHGGSTTVAKVAGAHNECSIAVISISMAIYKSNVSYMRTSVLVTMNCLLLFVLTPVTPEKK